MPRSLAVSEIFNSLQGEGATAGLPATFLRLAGCNLRCSWCDTEYSWNWQRYAKAEHVQLHSVATLAERLSTVSRLIVTGGEPLLQQAALGELFELLPPNLEVEVETNGTISPTAGLLCRITQWNVSPKLANAQEAEARRLNSAALGVFRDQPNAWLKLVVEHDDERREISTLVERLGWPPSRVLLQAQARSRETLAQRGPRVAALAQTLKLNYSPRLHLELWNGERGR